MNSSCCGYTVLEPEICNVEVVVVVVVVVVIAAAVL
jgi:hypothetical protein